MGTHENKTNNDVFIFSDNAIAGMEVCSPSFPRLPIDIIARDWNQEPESRKKIMTSEGSVMSPMNTLRDLSYTIVILVYAID